MNLQATYGRETPDTVTIQNAVLVFAVLAAIIALCWVGKKLFELLRRRKK